MKSELPISIAINRLDRNDLLMAFDATSLHLNAMVDEVYPKIESGNAFTKDMNDSIVEQFNSGTKPFAFAVLKVKFYNPNDIVLQHIAVSEEENKIEVNRLRNGYITDFLDFVVDIEEIVRIGGKVIEVYEGLLYRDNFKDSPLKNFFKKLVD